MGYVDDNLSEKERVLYRTKLHWATFLGPAMLTILGGLWIPSKGMPALVMFFLGVLWGIFSSLSFNASDIGLTERRLLVRVGFPLRRTCDVPLEQIRMVDVYQPSLGKFLNFGKVIIQYSDGRRNAFRMIASPLELREEIAKQFSSLQQELKEQDSSQKQSS